MKAEEQLELAYITIAELRDQNTKLIDALSSFEKKMAEQSAREREVMENFYRSQMEEMRELHRRDNESRDETIRNLTDRISELSMQLAAAISSGKANKSAAASARADKYGRKSEKLSRLGKKRDDDDRDEGKDNFNGSAGSDASTGDGKVSGRDADTISGIQKKILRTHPGSEIKVERIDYSKAKSYMDDPTYHRLEDYYTLPEGGRFLMKDGEIDKNYVRVIIRHPERYEEHIYETATVRFNDADDIRTIEALEDIDRPVKGCCLGTSSLIYVLMEKFWYNTPFEQIVRKLQANGVRMSKSTLGDNVHRAIEYMRKKMSEWWEKALYRADYWMLDETPGLVGCENADGTRSYRKKYFWTITAKMLGLSWLTYENGSRGRDAIARHLDNFIGFYTTDGYACYKIWDTPDDGSRAADTTDTGKKRAACLVHIRRPFVKSLQEDFDASMWFIDVIAKIFSKEHEFKEKNLKGQERWVARRKPGSVMDLMQLIEDKLNWYRENDFIGCGEALKKAVKYALAEWPAMKRVLDNGDVEISNNISEQSVRKLKMNLHNAGNIGSEASAANNAFMFSMIESCRLNGLAPEKYLAFLLGKLRLTKEKEDLTGLLPCYCGPL